MCVCVCVCVQLFIHMYCCVRVRVCLFVMQAAAPSRPALVPAAPVSVCSLAFHVYAQQLMGLHAQASVCVYTQLARSCCVLAG